MGRVSDLFGDRKPLIAMAHLRALPGTPMYDANGGLARIVEDLRADMEIILAADFDAVLFCNEGDLPYSFKAGYEGVAAMTRVVAELAPKDRPFGVDFLWDPQAALNIAAATGGSFIRCVPVGAYESDMGLWSTDVAGLLRERRRIDAGHVATFMNVTPEFASSLGTRSVTEVARSAVWSSLADAILISGPRQATEPDMVALAEVRETLAGAAPVFANTGATTANVASFLGTADGIIVGSALKRDGYTWNEVAADRVAAFTAAAGRGTTYAGAA
jgi:membrane complex biogenesis BtpA family protein